jgi:hypothetical protein
MTEQLCAEGFIVQFERHCSANESGPISVTTAWNRNQFDVHGR